MALFYGTSRDPDIFHRAVFIDNLHALQVGGEGPLVDFGHMSTNTALFLRFTATADAASPMGALSGDLTNSGHIETSVKGQGTYQPRGDRQALIWLKTREFGWL